MKKVAALVTVYRKWSHADVILTKVLEGYHLDGGARPDLQLVSLYVDQFPKEDLSRALAKKHGFTIYDTMQGALTFGGAALAVDGVLCIGEHGEYPTNAKGQILYPRRKFFEAVADVFAKSKKSVPVFSDKHLAATWADAKWMVDKARELFVPLLAGSSIPVSWRRPELTLPKDCDLTEAVSLGYGPLEAYGFHALEGLQCMAERRRGGETGVKAVQAVMGEAMWKALDAGRWSKELFEAARLLIPTHAAADVRTALARSPDSGVWLIEYRDGFRGAVPILNGYVHEAENDGGAFIFAGKLKGKDKPAATQYFLQQDEPFAHFACLLKAIDSMMQTGHPPYPVERTLLTTGMLDALMTSMAEKGRRVETPHLDIRYKPTEWGHAPWPPPKIGKR